MNFFFFFLAIDADILQAIQMDSKDKKGSKQSFLLYYVFALSEVLLEWFKAGYYVYKLIKAELLKYKL